MFSFWVRIVSGYQDVKYISCYCDMTRDLTYLALSSTVHAVYRARDKNKLDYPSALCVVILTMDAAL